MKNYKTIQDVVNAFNKYHNLIMIGDIMIDTGVGYRNYNYVAMDIYLYAPVQVWLTIDENDMTGAVTIDFPNGYSFTYSLDEEGEFELHDSHGPQENYE